MTITAQPYAGEAALIPLHLIDTAAQVRTRNGFDEESLKELADSIKAVGLLTPILLERTGSDRYRVLAGERRLLATSLAGLDTIPAMVRAEDTTPTRLAAQMVENLHRVDLALGDRAEGVAQLVKDLGRKEAGRLLGKSAAWISKALAYTALPALIREAADQGHCTDYEVLHCVAQLGKLKASEHPKAATAYDEALGRLAGGFLDRSMARTMLQDATAKPPAVKPAPAPAVGQDDEGEGEGEGQGDATPKAKQFAKLELELEAAQAIHRALEHMAKTGPNPKARGDAESQARWLADWINNVWGV